MIKEHYITFLFRIFSLFFLLFMSSCNQFGEEDSKISFNFAMVSTSNDIEPFNDRLNEIGLAKIILEKEKIKLYPQVRKRLQKEGIINYFR